ncbi:MAG: class I SAM-dependent methyltransferase, partial [Planctomycetota bacterium]
MATLDPDKTRRHWNDLADSYDQAKARNAVYYQSLKRLIDERVPRGQRHRVLDVGCGTGQILAHLEPESGVGIDASESMIEHAREAYATRRELRFEVHDAAAVDQLGQFDAVVSADLLEHVPDWRAVVAAIAQACTPGGRIVITTPSPRWAMPLWILETLRLKMPEGPHEFVPVRSIAAALEEDGCIIAHCGTHLLLPASLLGTGPRLSRVAERAPILRGLGVIQLVVADRARSAGTA